MHIMNHFAKQGDTMFQVSLTGVSFCSTYIFNVKKNLTEPCLFVCANSDNAYKSFSHLEDDGLRSASLELAGVS